MSQQWTPKIKEQVANIIASNWRPIAAMLNVTASSVTNGLTAGNLAPAIDASRQLVVLFDNRGINIEEVIHACESMQLNLYAKQIREAFAGSGASRLELGPLKNKIYDTLTQDNKEGILLSIGLPPGRAASGANSVANFWAAMSQQARADQHGIDVAVFAGYPTIQQLIVQNGFAKGRVVIPAQVASSSVAASASLSDDFQALGAAFAQEQREKEKKEMLRDVIKKHERRDMTRVLMALNIVERQKTGWEMLLDSLDASTAISRLIIALKKQSSNADFNAAHHCLVALLQWEKFEQMTFDEFLGTLLHIGHGTSAMEANVLLLERRNAGIAKVVDKAVEASNVFDLLALLSQPKITFRRNMNANAESVAAALKDDGGVDTAEQLLNLPDQFLYECGLTMTGVQELYKLLAPKPPTAAAVPATETVIHGGMEQVS